MREISGELKERADLLQEQIDSAQARFQAVIAVNGIAGWQYPPIQRVWNKDTYPETDIDSLIVRGLTLW